jgi:hypothetical protein
VTAAEINHLLRHLARVATTPAPSSAERAAFFAHKAALFTRLAEHPGTAPALARQAHQIAQHARNAHARHADNTHTQTGPMSTT